MLDVAQQAMAQWQHGTRTGEWSGLLAMMHPDVTFHVPVPEFFGIQHGSGAAEAFFTHVSSFIQADMRVVNTLVSAERIAFEVRLAGTMHAKPFAQGLCIVFAIEDGLVRSFSEYLAWPGGLDPDRVTGAMPS